MSKASFNYKQHNDYLIKSSIEVLSSCIDSIAFESDKINYLKEELYFKDKNSISSKDILCKLVNYSECELSTIICMSVLIDRMCIKKKLFLTTESIPYFLFGSFMVAIKMNEDYILSDKIIAKIVGVEVETLIKIESNFLDDLDYQAFISFNDYNLYIKNILEEKEN